MVDAIEGRARAYRADPERLRPPLHLLHHPLWPRQFALGADGRRGGPGEAPRRRRLQRGRALRRRHDQLGADLPGSPRLGDLVQAILRHVPGLARLRLSSIDSVEADPALVEAVASERRLMPHLHLSLQAGDDMILKRMKRRHLRGRRDRLLRRDARQSGRTSSSAPTSSPAFRPRPRRCSTTR